ncbi:MAG: tRNA (N6-isopentenyl adenosine(37)-C2)-methylthiotransferase MiaB, partial [Corynebacterium variabile]
MKHRNRRRQAAPFTGASPPRRHRLAVRYLRPTALECADVVDSQNTPAPATPAVPTLETPA